MSFLTRTLGLDHPASPELPVDPHAPLPSRERGRHRERQAHLPAAVGDAAGAGALPRGVRLPPRSGGRRRPVDERRRDGGDGHAHGGVGGLDAETARLVVVLATSQADAYGATEDYLVTREFKAISTLEEREQLLRCCFLVMAADDEIDETESWLANRLAEELDIERPDLNAIRDEFHDQLSSVREIRRYAAN